MAMELAVAFLSPAIDNLYSLLKNEVVSTWGVESDMEKLSSTLSTIYAVLEDAEQQQVKDKAIQNWLKELNDAAYEADDILDECAFEALRCESEGQGSSSASLKRMALSYLPTTYASPNIPFRHNIGNRIKEITDKFDAIAANRSKFHLNKRVEVERRVENVESRETSSSIAQRQLYGRDEDRDKIVKFLVEDVCDSEDVSVYPILGIGGLGKTTLAQMAFNDERVQHHFDPKIWVYVSQDFDVKRVIKATIESVDGKACEAVDLDAVQRRLHDKLNGKRYLIVLDDVWDEDPEKWDSLKYSLACGSKGASVIVTTRVDKVASIMGTISPHRLSFLSKEDCWLLFRQRAFGPGNEGRPNLVAIGKEIVKKCGGVPLAAKALGGLMRFKSEEKEWLRVKESEIWNLDQGKIPILPALRLSYFYLPLESRRCFAYCAIFPKGSDIRKRDLIHLWMANSYISCKGGWELEDIGDQICNELCLISFLQEVKKFKDDIHFKMHDLVHDLAQSIMKDECATIEFNSSSNISNEKVRHVTLVVGHGDNFNNTFHKVVTLRTLRLEYPLTFSFKDGVFLCDFSKFGSLRAFEARNKVLPELPSSIGDSKHLRYLNLHCARIKQLPDSICRLLNLQTLILEYCPQLERLPQNMAYLRSLRHLYLLDCWSLIEMPPKIGRLTYLKTLTTFVVGKSTDCSLLAELKCLNLGGELSIEHLERVSNPMDAKEANLVGKQNLSRLQLKWEFGMAEWNSQENVESESESESENVDSEDVDFEAQENVESESENVDSEDIDSEAQENVESESENVDSEAQENVESESENVDPEDVDSEAQENVESESKNVDSEAQGNVESEAQENVKSEQVLEALQPHPNLKELVVRGYKGTRFPLWMRGPDLQNVVDIELQGYKHCLQLPPLGQLPLLQKLRISKMREVEYIENEYPGGFPSLEELTVDYCPKLEGLSREEGRELFPRLREIQIAYCPKLSLPHLSSPKKMWFLGQCTMVLNSVSNLNNLTSLGIVEDKETVCFPKEFLRNLTLLESLSIDRCRKLKVFPEDLASLVTLKSLTIKDCRKLQSLPEEGLRGLESLQSLRIHACPKIASLPASIQSLTKLQRIQIVSCGRELERRCERGGDDWHKIEHIPEVSIKA